MLSCESDRRESFSSKASVEKVDMATAQTTLFIHSILEKQACVDHVSQGRETRPLVFIHEELGVGLNQLASIFNWHDMHNITHLQKGVQLLLVPTEHMQYCASALRPSPLLPSCARGAQLQEFLGGHR